MNKLEKKLKNNILFEILEPSVPLLAVHEASKVCADTCKNVTLLFIKWFNEIEENGSISEILNKPYDFVFDYFITNIYE